jgi:hypothetical protein
MTSKKEDTIQMTIFLGNKSTTENTVYSRVNCHVSINNSLEPLK